MNHELPDYESMLERFYRAFLRPGDVCIDVGAHEGRHLFPMLECIGARGRAVAFEPIPWLAEKLAKRLAHDGVDNVVVHSIALSDQQGRSKFRIAMDAPGYSGILERDYDVPTRVSEIDVELSTLDAMVGDLDRLDYLKVDAEGAEWAILRGAHDTLRRCKPVVTFEFGLASYGAYGVVPEDVHAFLEQMGYTIYDIVGTRLGCQEFADSSRHQAVWDYIALPPGTDAAALLAPLSLRG